LRDPFMRGSVLSHRIPRATPWGAQASCALGIGIVLLLIGGTICFFALKNDDHGLPLLIGGGFSLVALLLVYSGIHQFFAQQGVKETIFELEDLPVVRGEPRHGIVIQEGPIRLQSLRANVICMEETRKEVIRDGKKRIDRFQKMIWDTNILDEGELTLADMERAQREVVIEIPRTCKPSGEQGQNKSIEWRVEIWGRVKGRPDFMHPFVIEVR
jgi:hypothetical protein